MARGAARLRSLASRTMAGSGTTVRGRHARASSVRTWLARVGEPGPPSWRSVHAQALLLLGVQVERLVQAVADSRAELTGAQSRTAAAAALAHQRVQRLEQSLAAAQADLVTARSETTWLRDEMTALRDGTAGLQDETAELRQALGELREELVWAFAERRTTTGRPVAETA